MMKYRSFAKKTTQTTGGVAGPEASAGPGGVAVAPPGLGLMWLITNPPKRFLKARRRPSRWRHPAHEPGRFKENRLHPAPAIISLDRLRKTEPACPTT